MDLKLFLLNEKKILQIIYKYFFSVCILFFCWEKEINETTVGL